MTKGDMWLDEVDWKIWSDGRWITVTIVTEEKVKYLEEKLVEIEKITQNYFLLEEVVLDFIKSRPTDKAVIKFREVLEKLYATD